MNNLSKIPLILLNCLFCNSTWATDVEIHSTAISLPALTGFTEVSQSFPEVRQTAESVTPSQNRLLAVFLSDDDVAKASSGQITNFNRYVLVQTFREIEDQDVSIEQFSELKDSFRQNMGISEETLSEANRSLIRSSDEISKRLLVDLLISVEKPIVLSIDTDTESSFGGTILSNQLQTVNGIEHRSIMAANFTALLVKEKVVFFNLYSSFESNDDVQNLRWAAIDWVREIENANHIKKPARSQEVDLLIAASICLSVSLLPAYFLRYKILKRPMSKWGAALFLFGTYWLISLVIYTHAQTSHSEIQTRPGYIFLYLILWWVWTVVRKDSSPSEALEKY